MLLGFKPRFVEPIQLGTKVFTMRNKRKRDPKIGETLHMYTGLRTNKCQLITNKEKLISIQEVFVWIHKKEDIYSLAIYIDGRTLEIKERLEFVNFDGFIDVKDFCEYWIRSSFNITKNKWLPSETTVRGTLDLFHWTDLRY